MFDVKTEEGVVTGRVNGMHVDAAVVGETAGLEVSLDRMHAFDGHRATRAARLVLSLDMDPQTMRQIVVQMAAASGMPAFTDREWAEIAEVLRDAGRRRTSQRHMIGIADRIREAI